MIRVIIVAPYSDLLVPITTFRPPAPDEGQERAGLKLREGEGYNRR